MKRLIPFLLFLLILAEAGAQNPDSLKAYIIINGIPSSQQELDKVRKDSTVVIHFIPGNKAVPLYGPQAKNGALVATISPGKTMAEPVVFLEGRRIPLDSLNFNNVERIDVIRGQQAVNLYGPAGKNDVYIVHKGPPLFIDVIMRITDKNGKPVKKAEVIGENGSILAKSDKCGWVSLENFSMGNTVTISAGKKILKNLVITDQVMNVKL